MGAGRKGARRLSDRVVVTTTERLGDFAAFDLPVTAFFAVFFSGFFAEVFAFDLVFKFAFPPALEPVFDLVLEVVRGFDPVFAREVLLFATAFFFAAMVAAFVKCSHDSRSIYRIERTPIDTYRESRGHDARNDALNR